MTLLVSLTGTVLFHRKCDLLECNKESPLWKVFRGCGHSFHIECVLPDISVCKICESTLKEKIDSLGKVANDAVFHHNLRETVDDELHQLPRIHSIISAQKERTVGVDIRETRKNINIKMEYQAVI